MYGWAKLSDSHRAVIWFPFLSSLMLFCLVLLPFLSCSFCANGPFDLLIFPQKFFQLLLRIRRFFLSFFFSFFGVGGVGGGWGGLFLLLYSSCWAARNDSRKVACTQGKVIMSRTVILSQRLLQWFCTSPVSMWKHLNERITKWWRCGI